CWGGTGRRSPRGCIPRPCSRSLATRLDIEKDRRFNAGGWETRAHLQTWGGPMRRSGWPRGRVSRALRVTTLPTALATAIVAILVIGAGSAAGSAQSRAKPGKAAWEGLAAKLPLAHPNAKVDVKLRRA